MPFRSDERGAVTAEFAFVLPAIVLVLGLCLNALAAVTQQIVLQDDVADAARQAGRGESVTGSFAASEEIVCVSREKLVGVFPVSARSCALTNGR